MKTTIKCLLSAVLLSLCSGAARCQMQYGCTGLLHAPTAEMQRDRTFMLGGSMLHKNTFRSTYWNGRKEYDPYTYNYYLNVTFFPWLEIGYTCTLVKGWYGGSWPQYTWGKFTNQDRSFHGRLRLWKEGWWKAWTPQIVLGANDPGSHEAGGGGNIVFDDVGDNTNHLTRFFLAATKHVEWRGVGLLGAHASVIQFDGLSTDNEHGVAAGANFRFRLPEEGFWQRAANGVNLMAEYYDGGVNLGGSYSAWKERINMVAELYDGKYLSMGIYFKFRL